VNAYAGTPSKLFDCILLVVLVAFVGLELRAFGIESHYKYDIPMCALLLVTGYLLREQLGMLWWHYLLFAAFLIVHALGMFDLYDTYPLGIEYDYWVHGFFGAVAALILMRFISHRSICKSFVFQAGLTLLVVMGIAALHELYEFAGALLLGKGEGVLFIGAGDLDQWDTQKDMLNNLIGALTGITVHLILDNR